jgi:TolB protein
LADDVRLDPDAALARVRQGAARARQRRHRQTVGLVAALAVANVFAFGMLLARDGSPASPITPGEQRLFGVMSYTAGPKLVVVRPRTWDRTTVTTEDLVPTAPALAPGGRRVVFAAGVDDGPTALWSRALDGENLAPAVRLTDGTANDTHPAFSPDGERVAFASDRQGGHFAIWVMGADAIDPRPVTAPSGADDYHPSWSPDGTRIAFERAGDDGVWLMVIDVNGTDERRLLRIDGPPDGLSWSPDGAQLAFSDGDDVWVATVDGSGARRLTDGPARDLLPVWSPDASGIAFVRVGEGVSFVSADGGAVKTLVPSHDPVSAVAWSTGG